MQWKFDKAPDAGCLCSKAVLAGAPVRSVIHFSDDHSWAFLDGGPIVLANLTVSDMKSIVEAQPDLNELASLRPGCSAYRATAKSPWEFSPN